MAAAEIAARMRRLAFAPLLSSVGCPGAVTATP